jgi:hypothetical protein
MGTLLLPCINIKNIIIGNLEDEDGDEFLGNFLETRSRSSVKWLLRKGATRIRKSKQDRHHNGQKKKYKTTFSDLQTIHIKLKVE